MFFPFFDPDLPTLPGTPYENMMRLYEQQTGPYFPKGQNNYCTECECSSTETNCFLCGAEYDDYRFIVLKSPGQSPLYNSPQYDPTDMPGARS